MLRREGWVINEMRSRPFTTGCCNYGPNHAWCDRAQNPGAHCSITSAHQPADVKRTGKANLRRVARRAADRLSDGPYPFLKDFSRSRSPCQSLQASSPPARAHSWRHDQDVRLHGAEHDDQCRHVDDTAYPDQVATVHLPMPRTLRPRMAMSNRGIHHHGCEVGYGHITSMLAPSGELLWP